MTTTRRAHSGCTPGTPSATVITAEPSPLASQAQATLLDLCLPRLKACAAGASSSAMGDGRMGVGLERAINGARPRLIGVMTITIQPIAGKVGQMGVFARVAADDNRTLRHDPCVICDSETPALHTPHSTPLGSPQH